MKTIPNENTSLFRHLLVRIRHVVHGAYADAPVVSTTLRAVAMRGI